MKNNKSTNNNEDFELVDFDLNEYDEEFEKEAQKIKLKEARKEAKGSRAEVVQEKLKNLPDSNEPNRDLLKTIFFILIIIVIACLFLGLISFMVNTLSGKETKDDTKATHSTQSDDHQYENPKEDSTAKTKKKKKDKDKINKEKQEEEDKKKFEEQIDEITNTVIQDTTEEEPTPPTTQDEPTEDETETPIQEPEETPEPETTQEPEEIDIDATPDSQ